VLRTYALLFLVSKKRLNGVWLVGAGFDPCLLFLAGTTRSLELAIYQLHFQNSSFKNVVKSWKLGSKRRGRVLMIFSESIGNSTVNFPSGLPIHASRDYPWMWNETGLPAESMGSLETSTYNIVSTCR
jgi:hypothetical protein